MIQGQEKCSESCTSKAENTELHTWPGSRLQFHASA